MNFILYGAVILTLASLLVVVLVYGVVRLFRKPRRYWRPALLLHLLLVPIYGIVIVPFALAWFGVRNAHTRGDEAAYAGPVITAQGTWQMQSRASLAGAAKTPTTSSPYAVEFVAEDGVRLHGYYVGTDQPVAQVVIAHGLFRGGLEIEPVAAMFRELGANVLLLELRSHGRSQRAAMCFGATEALDVCAAVEFVRVRAKSSDVPVVLYGVSLGAAAVLLAAPKVSKLAALCVEAPMDTAAATGERMLNLPQKPGHRRLTIPQPFRTMILWGAEFWSGQNLANIRPIDAARSLPKDLPVLVIGGGDDLRMPPEVVRAVFEAMPMAEPTKQLWIREGSDHGAVFVDAPAEYRQRLADLLARVRSR